VTILDTNVVSEMLRPAPAEVVLNWLAAQEPLSVFITAITQAEILYGVEVLPAGKRREKLSAAVEDILGEDFRGRVLPVDAPSAREFAKISASRKTSGCPMPQFDAMIAAITRVHRATLATRNTSDFEQCGIRLVNPWDG
jgi:toxin FitB